MVHCEKHSFSTNMSTWRLFSIFLGWSYSSNSLCLPKNCLPSQFQCLFNMVIFQVIKRPFHCALWQKNLYTSTCNPPWSHLEKITLKNEPDDLQTQEEIWNSTRILPESIQPRIGDYRSTQPSGQATAYNRENWVILITHLQVQRPQILWWLTPSHGHSTNRSCNTNRMTKTKGEELEA